jgi:hypothetical protein
MEKGLLDIRKKAKNEEISGGIHAPYLISCGTLVAILDRLQEVEAENAELHAALLDASEIMDAGEWQTHHAAENTYCIYCCSDDEWWDDQKEHHDGCNFVETKKKVTAVLTKKA